MKIDYDGDPLTGSPESSLVRFSQAEPVVHRRAEAVGCTGYRAWYYRLPEAGWLPLAVLLALDPGGTTAFLSHSEDTDGDFERTYRILEGDIELHTEYGDRRLSRYDTVFCPIGAAHQLRNVGTERCWVTSWVSAGGDDGPLGPAGTEPADRPGYAEEYDRIMAARRKRGLSLPPGEDGEYGREIGERPELTVQHFSDAHAVVMPASKKTGANERLERFVSVEGWRWFSAGNMIRLEPGEQVDFHSHLSEHEGPLEEVYWIFGEAAELRTEYRDEALSRYDPTFYPPGASHQVRNTGIDTLWIGVWTSVGRETAAFDLDTVEYAPEHRPGYAEEYERIMAARAERDLPLPPGITVVRSS
jgi:mannose-6-phosphate isomerase-like protein (cupin superfamily)